MRRRLRDSLSVTGSWTTSVSEVRPARSGRRGVTGPLPGTLGTRGPGLVGPNPRGPGASRGLYRGSRVDACGGVLGTRSASRPHSGAGVCPGTSLVSYVAGPRATGCPGPCPAGRGRGVGPPPSETKRRGVPDCPGDPSRPKRGAGGRSGSGVRTKRLTPYPRLS